MKSVFNQKSHGPREQQHFRWAEEEDGFAKETDKDGQRWKEEKARDKSKRQKSKKEGKVSV